LSALFPAPFMCAALGRGIVSPARRSKDSQFACLMTPCSTMCASQVLTALPPARLAGALLGGDAGSTLDAALVERLEWLRRCLNALSLGRALGWCRWDLSLSRNRSTPLASQQNAPLVDSLIRALDPRNTARNRLLKPLAAAVQGVDGVDGGRRRRRAVPDAGGQLPAAAGEPGFPGHGGPRQRRGAGP